MTTNEILEMDKEGQLSIDISGLQQLLYVLKDYKTKYKALCQDNENKATEIALLEQELTTKNVEIEQLKIHINVQNDELENLSNSATKLEYIGILDLRDL